MKWEDEPDVPEELRCIARRPMILSSDVTDDEDGREGRDCFGGVAGSKIGSTSSFIGVSGRSFCSVGSEVGTNDEGGVGRDMIGRAGGGEGQMGFPMNVGLSGRFFVWRNEGDAGDRGGESGLV